MKEHYVKKIVLSFFCLVIAFFVIINANDADTGKKDKKNADKKEQDKQNDNSKGSGQNSGITVEYDLKNNDNQFFGKELLGKVTDNSVTIKVIPNKKMDVFFEYGKKSKTYTFKTAIFNSTQLKPLETVFENIDADTTYYYRMNYKLAHDRDYINSEEHSFHTQRKKGQKFVFTVTADPHLDDKTDPELMKKVFLSVSSNSPDFHIDLGDNFMSDKLIEKTEDNVIKRNLLFRNYFELIADSSPLYLVVGNHEGELGWNNKSNNTPDAMLSSWALAAKKTFFINPEPDGFYSGNTDKSDNQGFLQDYYAWEWGDALMVVIDPYRYTLSKPKTDKENWNWTLGQVQYNWLKTTLEKSKAKFKFVFSHQLVGGTAEGRGGAEFAKYFEQGGYNPDGTWGFDTQRAGWGKPVNQVMKENGVNIFFHGHDHLYAKQEFDGIIFQEVPQPGNDAFQTPPYAGEYGYYEGKILGNSGYLRITVDGVEAKADFIQLQKDKKTGLLSEKIADSYTISAPK
jgi:hypothetical protein